MITVTIYEDSDPPTLGKEVGAMYGMNEGQVGRLSTTIEREMVARMKLRTTVDLTEYGVGKQTLVVRKEVRAQKPRDSATARAARRRDPLPIPRSARTGDVAAGGAAVCGLHGGGRHPAVAGRDQRSRQQRRDRAHERDDQAGWHEVVEPTAIGAEHKRRRRNVARAIIAYSFKSNPS